MDRQVSSTRKHLARFAQKGNPGLLFFDLETRPRAGRRMLVGQHHRDSHNHADDKPDYETKPRRVTYRAFRQIEDSRRFVFMHARFSIASSREECKPRTNPRLTAN